MPGPTDIPISAVVFDVDGTLVDSERSGHRVAFNAAFDKMGLPYRWDEKEYGRLLKVTGGKRRIAGYLLEHGHEADEADKLAAELHQLKTAIFKEMAANGSVPSRAGVAKLLVELREAGLSLSVATTGTRDWVIPLLQRCFGLAIFDFVLTGTDIPTLKPDPAVYTAALERLGVDARGVVAVEDSHNGLVAARAAGIACLVVSNDYTAQHDFAGALAVLDSFGDDETPATQLAGEPLVLPGARVGPSTFEALRP